MRPPTSDEISWTNILSCSECGAANANHTVAHFFSCPMDLALGAIFGQHRSILAGSPSICRSAFTASWLRLPSSLTLFAHLHWRHAFLTWAPTRLSTYLLFPLTRPFISFSWWPRRPPYKTKTDKLVTFIEHVQAFTATC